jgi:ABC-type Mn2+/Zn2+ transport system permease subunit
MSASAVMRSRQVPSAAGCSCTSPQRRAALGVVLISAQPGISKDLTAALVGSPLIVGTGDIAVIVARGGLATLLAVTVVTAVPAVGATLPLALLVGPAAAALLWTRRIVPATVLGGLLGAAAGAADLATPCTTASPPPPAPRSSAVPSSPSRPPPAARSSAT